MPDRTPETPAAVVDAAPSLAPIATPADRFAILAIDQRGSLARMLADAGLPADGPALSAFKIEVVRALGPGMSGVLLDPDHGLDPVRAAGLPGAGTGVLVTLEAAERADDAGVRRTQRVPGRDGGYVRQVGGHAGKYLVWMRPDLPPPPGEPDPIARAVAEAAAVIAECRAAGVLSVVEALPHPAPGEATLPADRRAITLASARLLAPLQPDLLKLEYPGDAATCRQVTEIAGRVPWALLSAGMAFERFREALRVALEAGTSGFIAGRAFWQEAAALQGAERHRFLSGPGRERVEQCLELVAAAGRPWPAARAGL